MFRRVLLIFPPVIVIITAAIVWLIWGNSSLTATQIAYHDADLPSGFDGFRIVQLSDTHDAEIGPDNAGLTAAVAEAAPDMIVITGDIVDSNRTDVGRAVSLAARLAEIAPTYYVTGNHEALISGEEYARLISGLEDSGVYVLADEKIRLARGNDAIQLIGLRDIGFIGANGVDNKIRLMSDALSALSSGGGFDLVLSHRPELFAAYAGTGADLVLSGHAHGGQVRLPLIGGLIAPGQGLFPEYDSGLYRLGETSMIVSRGIGNSVIPLRINNRPEIVIIDLYRE